MWKASAGHLTNHESAQSYVLDVHERNHHKSSCTYQRSENATRAGNRDSHRHKSACLREVPRPNCHISRGAESRPTNFDARRRPMACMTTCIAWQPNVGLHEWKSTCSSASLRGKGRTPLSCLVWLTPPWLRRVTGYECSFQRTSTRGKRSYADARGRLGTRFAWHIHVESLPVWLRPKNLLLSNRACEME